MSKTPEEMAEEIENLAILDISLMVHNDSEWHVAKKAWLAGYKAAMEQVANASKVMPQWISVKDRLPEEDVAVLVYGQVLNDPPDIIGVRRRYNGDQEWKHTWESEDGFIYREDDVTHWMPLPSVEGLKHED